MAYLEELDSENLIVKVPDTIDEEFVSKIKLEILNLYPIGQVKRLFLNFQSSEHISSASLSVLFSLKIFLRSIQIQMSGININERVLSVFKAIGFDQILEQDFAADQDFQLLQKKNSEEEIDSLKSQLSYQKELYNRVTKDLETKIEKYKGDNKNLLEQVQQYDRSNSIGELAAGVAHEFNNIIGGILGYAQLAQVKKTDDIIDKALNNIIKLSKRVEGITTGLLNFSRRKPVKVAKIKLVEVIEGVLSFTQKQIENSRIEVQKDLKPVGVILGDENLISQVFLNLIINATHAMENGGVLSIHMFKANGNIVITVSDTGSGIKKAHLSRIFQPFFTTKGALGGGSRSGTGLGLSVSKSIIEMHEGVLEVASEEGVGTTFKITLPEKIGLKETKERIRDTDILEKKAAKSKLLVVDDEEVIRSLINVALTDQGHDVIEGANGEDGVKLYNSHHPDLVFLDVLMPRMNGMDAYLEIKRINPGAKVVFITGQAGEYLEKVLDNLVVNENAFLLRKPFEIEDLIRVTNVALNIQIDQ